MEILRVENLSKVYGKGQTQVTALDNVRVYVPTGKYTVKLDPNYTTDTMTATSQEYAVGETAKLPKNTFTRENYDFL